MGVYGTVPRNLTTTVKTKYTHVEEGSSNNCASIKMSAEDSQRNSLVFFVNGRKIVDKDIDPSLTLLAYLRRNLHLTGSKLGCGEGGCGACTVMLSRYDHQNYKIRHYAVNACYTPVCAVHGLAVTTVEGVGSSNKLHPIQERLANAHGLQCGFCTPGMVMSMYTLLRNYPQPTRKGIEEALVGNLCRCTGYRPILEGLSTFAENGCCGYPSSCKKLEGDEDMICGIFTPKDIVPYDPSQEPIFPPELQLSEELHSSTVRFNGKSVTWIRPVTLTELLKLKSDIPDAKLVVGNAEVKFEMMGKHTQHHTMISATHIPEMNHIEVTDDAMMFGASVTITSMGEALRKRIDELTRDSGQVYAALLELFDSFGDVQLRNVSGIGSHIMTASPLSDLIPLLMAAGSSVNIASYKGGNRTIPLDTEFITGYRTTFLNSDEVLIAVTIPQSKKGEYLSAYRVKKQVHRRDKSVAIVNAGLKVVFEENEHVVKDMTLCFGGTGPNIVMVTHVKEKVMGRTWDRNLLKDVLHVLNNLPISSQGGMVEYRKALLQSFFFKFFTRVLSQLHEKVHTGENIRTSDVSALLDIKREVAIGSQLYQEVPDGQSAIDPIGRPVMNESSIQIVTGEAVFTDDVSPIPGELYLAFVLSKRPHSKIVSVDTTAAVALDGVHCYVGVSDVPGQNVYKGTDEKVEIFASDKVIYVGQLIGGVVADSYELAQKATKLVEVQYEDLECILSLEDAIRRESFYQPVCRLQDGNVEEQFQQSDHIIEGEIYIGGQSHFYMETQCCVVRPQEHGDVMVISSTQQPTQLQTQVASALGIHMHNVKVYVKHVGGGFGGKDERSLDIAAACAVAAKKLGRPVRTLMERDKDMQFVGTRHSAFATYKVGCNKEGKLKAMDVDLYVNAGCYLEVSHMILHQAMNCLHSAYKIPAYKECGRVCRTNIASFQPMRGAGTPNASVIMESIMDNVARKCGVSSEKVRELNMYQEGDVDNFFQDMPDVMYLRRCWTECLQRSDYHQRRSDIDKFNRSNKWKKRGLAIVPLKRGPGLPANFLNQGAALVHIYIDGSVMLTHGGVELGQGLHTRIMQTASRVLRISSERIRVNETSTDKVPNTTMTGGSVANELFGHAIKNACEVLMERLKPFINKNPKGSWEEWVTAAYMDRVSLSATGFYRHPEFVDCNWDNPRACRSAYHFVYGAGCSEVEIDCLTGDHELKRADIVMDVGESQNPALDIGQIEGAFIQGYGLHVTEELRYSMQGELLSRGPGMYRLPQIDDIPSVFNIALLKGAPCKEGIYSSKAIGEAPIHLSSSILLAIKDAISSARSDHGLSGNFELYSPATPERIRLACVDEFTETVKVSEVEKDFFVRT